MGEIVDRDGPGARLPVGRSGRRAFLKAGGAAAAVLALGACDDIFGGGEDDGQVTLDLGTDAGVLNYVHALEQLQAAFYARVVGDSAFGATFSAEEQRVLRDLRDHEAAHRDFLAAAIRALGERPIRDLAFDFGELDLGGRQAVLVEAANLEDTWVAAYNGAMKYLRGSAPLTTVAKIASVEARHVSVLRDLVEPGTGAFAPGPFAPSSDPPLVLSALSGLFRERIRVLTPD